jgi:hypothetical protein
MELRTCAASAALLRASPALAAPSDEAALLSPNVLPGPCVRTLVGTDARLGP